MLIETIKEIEEPGRNDPRDPGEGPGGKDESILIFVGYYLPGFKAGGPIRSVSNLVETLGKEFNFKVVTSDRDLGDRFPYPGVVENQWVRVGNADVMYLFPGWRGILSMVMLLRSVDRKVLIYLNSAFSRRFSILPIFLRRLGLIDLPNVVLAPRGEFSPGALNLKRRKKSLYLMMSRWLGLYRDIIWHASSELEAADIRRIVTERRAIAVAEAIPSSIMEERRKRPSGIAVAEDIPGPLRLSEELQMHKHAGHIRIAFVSRISRKKNLTGALRMLEHVSGDVEFNIYGPAEDARYWDECQKVIATLPVNVQVKYWGTIEHERIAQVFAESHLFLFPTLGENYGHVICEALIVGCPVLISDQTPWNDLEEKNAGWSIPLSETERFRAIIQLCVDADAEWYTALSACAKNYAKERISNPRIINANRMLFRYATARQSSSIFNFGTGF